MRIEKRCPTCSTKIPGRRCDHCGKQPTWGFIVEAGTKNGRRRRIVRRGFHSRAEAEKAGRKLEHGLDTDEFVEPSALTVRVWLKQWLELEEPQLKPSTFASYRNIVRAHLIAGLGDLRLQAVQRHHLEHFYAGLIKTGRSTGTVKNVHAVLRKALADAVERRLIKTNPSARAFRMKVERQEMRAWGSDELRAFLTVARGHRLGPVMRLAAMTGMRRGEVLGLQWTDVDLKNSRLHVRRSLTKGDAGPVLVEPKSRRARRAIDLDPETVSQLRAWRTQQLEEALIFGRESWTGNNPRGALFTKPDGSPLDPDTLSHAFGPLCVEGGLEAIRFHDLRHTHASLLLKGGTPLHVVSRRLGHSSAAFTADVYSHVLPGQGAEAAAQLASMVD